MLGQSSVGGAQKHKKYVKPLYSRAHEKKANPNITAQYIKNKLYLLLTFARIERFTCEHIFNHLFRTRMRLWMYNRTRHRSAPLYSLGQYYSQCAPEYVNTDIYKYVFLYGFILCIVFVIRLCLTNYTLPQQQPHCTFCSRGWHLKANIVTHTTDLYFCILHRIICCVLGCVRWLVDGV